MTLELFKTTPIQLCVLDALGNFSLFTTLFFRSRFRLYLNHLPFGEVNDLNLFLFEFQSSPLLVAVPVPSLGMPFLSSVKTGSMKVHPTEVVLAHNSYDM